MEKLFSNYPRIVTDPAICDGQPRITGVRITVAALLSYLAGGMQFEEILAGYPKLTDEDIREALSFAANHVEEAYFEKMLGERADLALTDPGSARPWREVLQPYLVPKT